MPRHGDLAALLRAARQLAKLCEQALRLVSEARDHDADTAVTAMARKMASELQRTKHAAEDELVAFVLDCERCGRRVHWVQGEGMRYRLLGTCGASAERPWTAAPSIHLSGKITGGCVRLGWFPRSRIA